MKKLDYLMYTLIVIVWLLLLLLLLWLIIVVAIVASIIEGPTGAHPPVLAVPRHQGGGHDHHHDGDPDHDAGEHFLTVNTKETISGARSG